MLDNAQRSLESTDMTFHDSKIFSTQRRTDCSMVHLGTDEADTKTESKEPKANRDRYNGIATSGLDIAGGFGEGDGKRTSTNTDTPLQRDVCNVCLHLCLIILSRLFLGCVKHVNQ